MGADRELQPKPGMRIGNGPGEKQRARIVKVLIGLDDFRSGRGYKLAGIEFDAVPGFRLETDISLHEVFPGVRIAVAGMDNVEVLAETDVQMKADGSRRMVNRDHAHADVRRVGAHVEASQCVDAGSRVVEVGVYVPVEKKVELRTPLPERRIGRRRGSSRRGRRRRGGRCLSCRGIIGSLRLSGGRASQDKPDDQSGAVHCPHNTPSNLR